MIQPLELYKARSSRSSSPSGVSVPSSLFPLLPSRAPPWFSPSSSLPLPPLLPLHQPLLSTRATHLCLSLLSSVPVRDFVSLYPSGKAHEVSPIQARASPLRSSWPRRSPALARSLRLLLPVAPLPTTSLSPMSPLPSLVLKPSTLSSIPVLPTPGLVLVPRYASWFPFICTRAHPNPFFSTLVPAPPENPSPSRTVLDHSPGQSTLPRSPLAALL